MLKQRFIMSMEKTRWRELIKNIGIGLNNFYLKKSW